MISVRHLLVSALSGAATLLAMSAFAAPPPEQKTAVGANPATQIAPAPQLRPVAPPQPGVVTQPVGVDLGITVYHRAAGDGVGARICVFNEGKRASEPVLLPMHRWKSVDGVNFPESSPHGSLNDRNYYPIHIPALRHKQSHCFNIMGNEYFQRIDNIYMKRHFTSYSDTGTVYTDRDEMRESTPPRTVAGHPNSAPSFIIPKR